MKPSLESSIEKLGRAKLHLENFKIAAREYASSNPYDHEFVGTGINRTLQVRLAKPIPTELSLIAGDFLHNARSALDHLAANLAAKTVGATAFDASKISFPICTDGTDFRSWKRNNKSNFDPSDIDEFKSLQPYFTSQEDGPPLLCLSELNNLDKHRTFAFMVPVLSIGSNRRQDTDLAGSPERLHENRWASFDYPDSGTDHHTYLGVTSFSSSGEVDYYEVPHINVNADSTMVIVFDDSTLLSVVIVPCS